jgi:hypothetical protein
MNTLKKDINMTYKEGFQRALATFIAGAAAAPISGLVLDVDTLKVVLASGLAAVLNLVVRWTQVYLEPIEVQ